MPLLYNFYDKSYIKVALLPEIGDDWQIALQF